MRIAGKKTIEDWKKIESKLNSQIDENWEEAFKYFDVRIKTRYLDPINLILKMKTNTGEGFAVVNLQCSLIETLESFINGCSSSFNKKKRKNEWKKNNNLVFKSNKEIFESFFNKRDPFINYFQKIDGNDFYENVRCSILHETQTKKDWVIRKNIIDDKTAFKLEKSSKILYRDNFQNDLEILIDNYKKAIINFTDLNEINKKELRDNFILKFNHICNES